MITDQPIDADRPWGAPAPQEPDRPRWSGRKTAVALAVAVVIAGAGGVAIYAATANDSGTTPGGGGPGGAGGPGFGGPNGGLGRPGGMGALADALHGEFVIAGGSTELLQTGKVTQVSTSSLAVLSTDGYAKTYTIDTSTVIDNGQSQAGDLKTGDQVTVIAKSEGTAVTIEDRTTMGQGNLGVPQQPPPGR